MRSLLLSSFLLLACSGGYEEDFVGLGADFLNSRETRRAVLEESLVDPSNGYSQLRLQNYGRDEGWEELPPWNPPARPFTLHDLQGLQEQALASIETDVEWNEAEILALGKRAFESWPLSDDATSPLLLQSPADLNRFGVWVDDRERVGGLVVYEDGEGELAVAKTCASCHAEVDSLGQLIHGAGNPDYRLGDMLHAAALASGSATEEQVAYLLDWGPGHVDSTSDGVHNPTGIPDLRPIRYQNHLNAAASVRNSLLALAVRTETLMITSRRQKQRPPREIAFAVAYYLWSLGEPEPSVSLSDTEQRGQEVFEIECGGCHYADGRSADPVPLALVGTDPAAGLSPMRGTGNYRIPSLFGVAKRGRLLHRSQVRSLEEHLSPARLETTPGHRYGLALDTEDRRALIAFLGTI